jgi:hypothetical protein
MRSLILSACGLAAAAIAQPAAAQTTATQPGATPAACCPQPVAPTTLSLSAESNVKMAPDLATISAGVITLQRTAKGAMEENAKRMTAVFGAIRAAGVADRDMQTSGVTLAAQYDYQPNQRPRITGYQATNTVTIRMRDLNAVGPVLDALVTQGANQINGPTFGLDNPDAALDKARTEAMGKAMRRAELYAKAAGLRVSRVVSITESGGYSPPQPIMMARMAMASADAGAPETQVAPGEVTLNASVSVVFELAK